MTRLTSGVQRRGLRRRVLEIRHHRGQTEARHDGSGEKSGVRDAVVLYAAGAEPRLCSAGAIPFADKSFEFVTCKNVLQKLRDPVCACRELMRVARRGYVECPRSWAQYIVSSESDLWFVDLECDTLIFRERLAEEYREILNVRTRMRDPRFVEYWNSAAIRAVRCVELRWASSFSVRALTSGERRNGCGEGQQGRWLRTLRRARDIDAVRRELHTKLARAWRA